MSDDLDRDEPAPILNIQERLDPQYIFRVLRKHKWPICLFSGLVTALAAYYATTATPIYSATSTLLIEPQKANVVSIEELYGVDNEKDDYYQTQFALLRSRSLATKVANKLELWTDPELSPSARLEQERHAAATRTIVEGESGIFTDVNKFIRGFFEPDEQSTSVSDPKLSLDALQAGKEFPIDVDAIETAKELDRKSVVSGFMSRLSISPVRGTKLVHISYESVDPEKAALIANGVGEGYIESYLESKLELTTKASKWLNERLGTLKITLDESEDRLLEFKKVNGLVDVNGGVARLNEQNLLLLTSELAQARSALSDAADVYREVQTLSGSPLLLETISKIQSNALVQRIKIEQGQAQRQLDELRNRYGEKHPSVVDARSQLLTLEQSLGQSINAVVGTIEKDYQLLRQRVASIESKLASGKDEIQAIGTKTFELGELEREVAVNRNIYDTFFNRMSEAKSADGLETANARVSDLAIPPTGPIKPQKQLIVGLAALVSLVLSMLMAFLYEQLDSSIKSTNDVEDKLGRPLLGILPLIKTGLFKRERDLPLNPVTLEDPKGTFTEAVNTARTSICIEDADNPRQVITVTSSVPGEGKSTVSINLAYSLAQLERVLLIDCDMRRPTVAKAVGLDKNSKGLVDLITGNASAQECITRGVFDGYLDVIPSGTLPYQPLELLASRRFERILEKLKQHYDRIVIDSAPTHAVSDALVLGKLSDAVVYAVKSHDTSIELVKRGLQRLEQAGAPIAGVLMTQVDIDRLVSYGGDYYYQGYYDYYGYTEKGVDTKKRGKLRLTKEDLLSLKQDDVEVDLHLETEYRTSSARFDDSFETPDLRQRVQRAIQSPLPPETRRTTPLPTRNRRSSKREDLDIL